MHTGTGSIVARVLPAIVVIALMPDGSGGLATRAVAQDPQIGSSVPAATVPAGTWGEPSVTEKEILETLDAPAKCDFHETPLADVVEFLRQSHGIEIQFDRRALDAVGISSDSPITGNFRGISLRSGLRMILDPLDLHFVVHDEVLLITTREGAESRLYHRVYPIGGLIGSEPEAASRNCFALTDLVTQVIQPESWDDVGGPASVASIPPAIPQSLVVFQTFRGHEEMDKCFRLLRRVGKIPLGIGSVPLGLPEPATEKRIAEALRKPAEFKFIDTSLADVVEFLEQRFEIEIQLNHRALDEVGIDGAMPVTVSLKTPSLASALRQILREFELTYAIRDEVLWITTPEDVEARLTTRVYPLQDLMLGSAEDRKARSAYADELVEKITGLVRPTTWDFVGGPGSVVCFSAGNLDALVIAQTDAVHDEVAGLLMRPEFRRLPPPPAEAGESDEAEEDQPSSR